MRAAVRRVARVGAVVISGEVVDSLAAMVWVHGFE
jgi:hypothetical protein